MSIAERDEYLTFLEAKRVSAPSVGFSPSHEINPQLFPFQRDIVRWALQRGRAAIFADCGLGKTPMQLEWARHVHLETGGDVLILAPLAVAQQTRREGDKFGVPVTVCRSQTDVRPGVNITNYEMLPKFDADGWAAVVLDESSILKGNGPLFEAVSFFAELAHYRLACTATPAPNDHEELLNHAEFLGLMRANEILALYFTQDGNTTHKWRLKRHAVRDWWDWVATWAVAIRSPSDLGYPDDGFILPELRLYQHTVEARAPQDALFQAEAQGIIEQRRVRRDTLEARVATVAGLIGSEE